ncbi:hypothetical protein H0H93_013821 [Arthromyces matolae]|nr:hypothetical protein H0H93_013821 [Arthromyces matolae]
MPASRKCYYQRNAEHLKEKSKERARKVRSAMSSEELDNFKARKRNSDAQYRERHRFELKYNEFARRWAKKDKKHYVSSKMTRDLDKKWAVLALKDELLMEMEMGETIGEESSGSDNGDNFREPLRHEKIVWRLDGSRRTEAAYAKGNTSKVPKKLVKALYNRNRAMLNAKAKEYAARARFALKHAPKHVQEAKLADKRRDGRKYYVNHRLELVMKARQRRVNKADAGS